MGVFGVQCSADYNPTAEQREILLRELAGHRIASRLPDHTREMGLTSSFEIFADFEMVFTAGFSHVIIRRYQLQSTMHVSRDLAPALTFAHHHFGDMLPRDLISKLRNKTQTLDTLFELHCLGLLQVCHTVSYEPTLTDGKVPDLVIAVPGFCDVYVECKSQSMLDTEHQRILQKFTSLCFEAVEKTPAREEAWQSGLRTEIRISATPQRKEIDRRRPCRGSLVCLRAIQYGLRHLENRKF